MAIMCFSPKIVVPFVPSYGGNRREKIKTIVGIKPMNNDGTIEFTRSLQDAYADCDNEQERASVFNTMARQTFIDHVAYIKNYTFIDEKGKAVEDPSAEQLYDDGASNALVKEISIAIENSSVLSKGQEKNFEGDSDGPS